MTDPGISAPPTAPPPSSTDITTVLPPPPFQALPGEAAPSVLAAADAAPATERIVCPECKTVAMVTLNQRKAQDFCSKCDYPLFWVPARVLLGHDDGSDAALRRLPGTVGRATIGSQTCPHCSEPNPLGADVCVRCKRSLHPVAPAPVYLAPLPEPEPVYYPEPVPIEPEPRSPWWAWAIIFVLGTVAITLVTFLILTEIF